MSEVLHKNTKIKLDHGEPTLPDVFKVKDGDVFLFLKGRDDKVLSHSLAGKVIFSRKPIKPGYYIVNNVEDKKSIVLCDTTEIIVDSFKGIDYDTLLKVLVKHNFKIGFDREFEYNNGIEHQIFAYDLDTKMVIVAETWDKGRTFNQILLTCPMISAFELRGISGFSHGSSTYVTFDLCNMKAEEPLDKIKRTMVKIKDLYGDNFKYKDASSFHLWTYADNVIEDSGDLDWTLGDKTMPRLNLADKNDMKQLFDGCDSLLKYLDTEEE